MPSAFEDVSLDLRTVRLIWLLQQVKAPRESRGFVCIELLGKQTEKERIDMKTRLAVVLIGLACLLAASVASRAAVKISFSAKIEIDSANDFYEPLTPYEE